MPWNGENSFRSRRGPAWRWPPAGHGAFRGRLPSHFGLHPFIESHPEAVFVLRTSVSDRKDAAAKQSIGKTLAKRLFTLQDATGIPLSSKIAIKPNLTHNCKSGDTYAIITDREFLGGMIDGMKETGFSAGQIYVRDGIGTKQADTKYQDMAARTGVHYDDSADRETDLQGRVPTASSSNASDTWGPSCIRTLT